MKNFFLFLIFSILSCEVFAQENAQQGILREIVEKNLDQLPKKNKMLFKPSVSGNLYFDLRSDDNYQSTSRKDEYKNSTATMRFLPSFNFNENLSLSSQILFDHFNKASETARRNNSPKGGGNMSFEDEGVFLQELNLNYKTKDYLVLAGKFNLNYGTAWRWDRGLWTWNVADNYRQREKLGFSGLYNLGNSKTVGLYKFGFSAFTNDRKNLDNALITSKDPVAKSDGQAGDTRSLQSYSASLDISYDFGKKFEVEEKLSYHFAYLNLAVNSRNSLVAQNKIADQKGFVAGINYKYPVRENYTVDGLLEYESTRNLNGNSDIAEQYFTANLINRIYQDWNVTLGYAKRDRSQVAQYGFEQNFAEISLGYEFKKNWFFDKFLIQVGYKNQRTDYGTNLDTQNVLGGLARYYKSF